MKAWENFMSGLQAHELGHGQYGIDAAREIESDLGNTERRSDCGVLGADVEERARRIVEEYQALDAQYEIDTDHGRSQGAYLP